MYLYTRLGFFRGVTGAYVSCFEAGSSTALASDGSWARRLSKRWQMPQRILMHSSTRLGFDLGAENLH
jgi:hypothetical protein